MLDETRTIDFEKGDSIESFEERHYSDFNGLKTALDIANYQTCLELGIIK